MDNNVRVTKVPSSPPAKLTFADLAVGEWYESDSCYGLCVKLGGGDFLCVSQGGLFTGSQSWPVRRVRVSVKYRELP